MVTTRQAQHLLYQSINMWDPENPESECRLASNGAGNAEAWNAGIRASGQGHPVGGINEVEDYPGQNRQESDTLVDDWQNNGGHTEIGQNNDLICTLFASTSVYCNLEQSTQENEYGIDPGSLVDMTQRDVSMQPALNNDGIEGNFAQPETAQDDVLDLDQGDFEVDATLEELKMSQDFVAAIQGATLAADKLPESIIKKL
ncbi:hypothetical protein BU17DRAFT_97883 [Hysterangium stoloniferum]|nr:hypothetical protein BU17DRAFT_97883 [Hysterangium stoloniferum]